MPKQIIIAEQHRIAAVFSEDQIQELIVATGSHQVGDIYLGSVENVLPGIDAAFVNIGDSERNGFIHVSDLGPLRLKRSAASITELLAPQQKVLVQVMKEPTGSKGPRLTGNVTLPGRYLVLMPFGKGVNLSRRIRNEGERNRLRALAILVKPAGMGLLVRTEAEGVGEDAIIEDLEMLQRQWEAVQQEAITTRAPSLLNRDDDFIQRVLRDMYSGDVNRIVADSNPGFKRVKQHLSNWSGGKTPQVLVDHHRDRVPILEYFRVNAAIREALKPRVDLPSGGYIIIEPTEALTVVDVNSGSFTRSATARETVLWTNCEAAVEIARQLRLRNIAGVIIVDFIDMDSRRDQMQVLEQFNKALKADKSRPQIAQLSELGLVELTRKRQGQNIYELFGRICPTCGGLGHTVHLPGEQEVDPVIADPARDVIAANSSLPTPVREALDVPIDELAAGATADAQELDLVNHPSYQDRGSASRRRRRRRVVESTSRTAPKLPDLAEPEDTEDTESTPATIPAPVPAAKESRSEKSERRSSRREKTPPQPSQIICVEMTQEEQELYAMMGISPLVLSSETVKDPRSTIVQVVLPGEAKEKSSTASPTATLVNESTSKAASAKKAEPAKKTASAKNADQPSDQSTDTPESTNGKSKSTAIAESEPVSASANSDGEAEPDNGNKVRRRRRRRSSASSDSE